MAKREFLEYSKKYNKGFWLFKLVIINMTSKVSPFLIGTYLVKGIVKYPAVVFPCCECFN